jgi:hypothetical protein
MQKISLSSDVIDRLIDRYTDAWNEDSAEKRRLILDEIWDDNGAYVDPSCHISGKELLVQHIGSVRSAYPGGKIIRTSRVDFHHYVARFSWHMIMPDGRSLPEGIDFVDVSNGGKIQRVAGFFGALKPLSVFLAAEKKK